MRGNAFRFVMTVLLTALVTTAAVAAEGYVVVVNPANHVSTIPRHVLASMFMKKVPAWENGTALVPVDRPASSAIRETFSNDVHHKAASAIRSYWQQQIFSGRDVPPLEKASDEDVIAFVKNTPGAISYVAPGTPTEGLRIVKVTE